MEQIDVPIWVERAIDASRDFHYGIENEIETVWADSALTEQQKKGRIERLMINARHAKWDRPARTSTKTSTGRRFR